MILDEGHWIYEDYKQQVTRKEWRNCLLERGDDRLIFQGRLRTLTHRKVFADIIEIFKKPVPEEKGTG